MIAPPGLKDPSAHDRRGHDARRDEDPATVAPTTISPRAGRRRRVLPQGLDHLVGRLQAPVGFFFEQPIDDVSKPGRRRGIRSADRLHRRDVLAMVKRRADSLGLPKGTCCHTFRATGITAYLKAGGTLENAQAMAAHESPRATKLYDGTGDEITLDEVERIMI